MTDELEGNAIAQLKATAEKLMGKSGGKEGAFPENVIPEISLLIEFPKLPQQPCEMAVVLAWSSGDDF